MSEYLEKKKARRREVAALFGISENAISQEDAQSNLIASIYAQYPNYFYKPIIDALALAFRAQDGFDYFSYSMFNHYSKTLKSGCYIRVCNRDEKVRFLEDFESAVLLLMHP